MIAYLLPLPVSVGHIMIEQHKNAYLVLFQVATIALDLECATSFVHRLVKIAQRLRLHAHHVLQTIYTIIKQVNAFQSPNFVK
jgi:hypothetical protein